MLEVLRFICSNAGLRQKVEDYAVTILPAGGNDVDLYQRTFSVPPGFQSALRTTVGDGGGEVSDDPFGGGGESSSGLKPMPSIRSLLQRAASASRKAPRHSLSTAIPPWSSATLPATWT